MWTDVKAMAREGVLLGVKYGLAAALTLLAVSYLLGDYYVVRERSLNGQRAFEYIAQVQQQQAQQRQQAPGPPGASGGGASQSPKP